MYGCDKDCLILVPFMLPLISCFTLSLKCFSPDLDNCPDMGIGPLLQFPHPPKVGPILLTLLVFPLVPSPYRVLHGSIYSFPLVRYSCPLSASVLHALLCLKVYSWSIQERDVLHIHLILHHLVVVVFKRKASHPPCKYMFLMYFSVVLVGLLLKQSKLYTLI